MQIKVKIRGTSALLMNRFTEKAEVAVSGGTSFTLHGDKGTPRDQASLKRYCDNTGNLFLPGANIFSSLVAAGAFHKAGKSKLITMKTSLIPAGLTVSDLVCPIVNEAGAPLRAWEVDSRSVVIPSTGGRQLATSEESDAIAAVAMAAYQKIGEGIALLDECPEVNPVPAAAKPKARPARTKRKGK